MPQNSKPNKISVQSGQHPQQVQLTLFPVKEVEVDGIGMGVLNDGTPYLTLRGLARMCGVDSGMLSRLSINWEAERIKPRGIKIEELLLAQGHDDALLHFRVTSSGIETHAYTDAVCMAILEYYAFEANRGDNRIALNNFRLLARSSVRSFIYNRCGYDPNKSIPEAWKTFHERVLLNDQVPANYFSVFREIADLVVHLIQKGCPLDDHTVPDISVGKTWAKHWSDNEMDSEYGERQKHPHVYPDWFPQSAVNPVEAWIYPVSALGGFRVWVYSHYIPQNFPKYVSSKVKSGVFLPSQAELLIDAVSHKGFLPSRDA